MNTMKKMKRYDGGKLGTKPHIAVLGSCKVGNFVVTLPLLRLLRKKFPDAKIDFWGTEATRDFEIELCGEPGPINWRISWDKPEQNISSQCRMEGISKAKSKREKETGN